MQQQLLIPNSPANITVQLATSLDEIDAMSWDALVSANSADAMPLISHAFLSALEHSGSVGQGTGWNPCPLIITQNNQLVGAMPLYLKSHSYGEYRMLCFNM